MNLIEEKSETELLNIVIDSLVFSKCISFSIYSEGPDRFIR